MSTGIETLPRILKDQTRRQAIILLSERGSLSYTELMGALGCVNTGSLNYHLKVLGDLLTKNDAGKYVLSDKGEIAFRLLKMFPDEDGQLLRKTRQKQFWTVAAVGQVVYFLSVLTLYYLNYLDFGRLVLYTVWFIVAVGLAYVGYRVHEKAPASGSLEEKGRARVAYPMVGEMVGLLAAFFAPTVIILLNRYMGGPDLAQAQGSGELWTFILVAAPLIGAVTGYFVGKKKDFTLPTWMG